MKLTQHILESTGLMILSPVNHFSTKMRGCLGQNIQEWTKENLWKTTFTWSTLEYFDPFISGFSVSQ